MDKDELEALVRRVKRQYLRNLAKLLSHDDNDNIYLLSDYQKAFLEREFGHTPNESADQGYFSYKISRLFPDEHPNKITQKIFSQLTQKELIDPDTLELVETIIDKDISDFDLSYFKSQEEIEKTIRQAYFIKGLVSKGDLTSASKHFDELKHRQESELTFFEAFSKYIEAGKTGDLPNPKVGRAKPWEGKVLTDYIKACKIFCHHLGEKRMISITPKDVDNLFSQVISCLPKLNRRPYAGGRHGANIELALEHLDQGMVSHDNLITGVGKYKEKLDSFYRYYKEKLGGSDKAIKEMNFEIPDANKRGAFSDKQFKKIISFSGRLNDYKKWAVWIMALTGMRNGEVQQLRKRDITKTEEGTYFFKVREDAGSLKNKNSARNVPIHNFLLRNGLLEFVENSVSEYLFKCYSNDSKFLTRLYTSTIKPQCNLPDKTPEDNILSLYSLRHYVFTFLSRGDIPDKDLDVMLGHTSENSGKTSRKYYIHADTLENQKKYIDTLVPE